jgi:hypothetical protein
MSAADKKAPAATDASTTNTITDNCRISPDGFKAIRHLLDATRTLHSLTVLPLDAIQGAEILLCRITSDIERLGGGK